MIKIVLTNKTKNTFTKLKSKFLDWILYQLRKVECLVDYIHKYDCKHGIHGSIQWKTGYKYYYGVCPYCLKDVTGPHTRFHKHNLCPCKQCSGDLYNRFVSDKSNDEALINTIQKAIAGLTRFNGRS